MPARPSVFLVLGSVLLGVSCSRSTEIPDPSSAGAGKPLKVAFVYPGPHNDGGYSQAHDEGRLYLEQHVPNVKTAWSENVPEGSQSEKVFRDYAAQGYDVIFGTSFGFMDPMVNASKDFPKTVFMHASGFKRTENLGTYFGRIEQPDYLAGLVAGSMSTSGYIGFVIPFSIPECIREVDAFTVGVREANPRAEVHVIYTNSWFDPVKEGDATRTFIANGADVIASGTDSPAPLETAFQAGKYSIGYDMDQARSMKSPEAARSVLTSPTWHWGPYYAKVVQSVRDGTWSSSDLWAPMSEGMVDLAPLSDAVPPNVRTLVDERKKAILGGSYTPFDGPMVDQQGVTRVPAGERMSDADQLQLQWFVKGVVGSVK
jgi:basic membrane protein A and related proteins